MRIVHAANSAKSTTLGIERVVTSLAVAQKAHGSDVMIVIDRHGAFTETCQQHGISVMVQPGLGRLAQRGLSRLAEPGLGYAETTVMATETDVKDFIECLETFKPDIIHCHTLRAGFVAISAANRVNIPCVITSDDPMVMLEARKRGLRFAAVCLTAAGFGKLKNEIPDLDVYYVPNGTRTVPRTQEPQAEAADSVNLIFSGSLIVRKGVDIAILAMVELRRRLGPACPVLNIYGDGPRRDYLTEMVAVLELNDFVRFHGFKPGIMELCPSTDILIMPSRYEASPLVILEAMSRGMPIVATDVGDVTQLLPDRRYGRVIPPDSAGALAKAIESLLTDIADEQFDADLLIERHRSLYSAEKWAGRMAAAYQQVLLNNAGAVH
jgi:glycosyltransferase involved in cell wall biosynthesis